MDFDDLVEEVAAPEKRASKVANGIEHKMHEGAVMVAYAMHLLRTTETDHVRILPDGEHGKRFDFVGWLARCVSACKFAPQSGVIGVQY